MIKVMAFAQTRKDINEYAKGKSWQWHVPLWLFGLYLFVQLVGFNLTEPMPFAVSVMHSFDFVLHEFAHVFTAWLPAMITALAGSGAELLLGALLVYGAFQFRNYFASLFCCLWFMLACMSVGTYMADAVTQKIPLVSLGAALAGSDEVTHDWNFIFGQLGWLDHSAFIGGMVKAVGIAVGLSGVAFSAWIMYKMAAASGTKELSAAEKSLLAGTGRQIDPKTGLPIVTKASIYPEPTRGNLAHPSPTDPPKEEKKQ